jgi:hypothetical protein
MKYLLLTKITLRKSSLIALIGVSFLFSALIFGTISQVSSLVDENLEYSFSNYNPHAVYALQLDLGRDLNPQFLLKAINDTLMRFNLENESVQTSPLFAFSWSYLKPLKVNNRTVYVSVYFFRGPETLEKFGFRGNFSSNSVVLLNYNLTSGLNPERIAGDFFGGRVSLVKSYGVFYNYPLPTAEGVEYIQLAVPLGEETLNACIRNINGEIVNSSGFEPTVYIAITFKKPTKNSEGLKRNLTSVFPARLVQSSIEFYGDVYRNSTLVISVQNLMNNTKLFYFNGTWINPNKNEEALIKLYNYNPRFLPLSVSLRSSDILQLVRNAATQVGKFFKTYAGVLSVIYLPLFLLIFYSAETIFISVRRDLEILRIRGMSKSIYIYQTILIFALATLSSAISYFLFNALSIHPVSPGAGVAALLMVLLTVVSAERIGKTKLGNTAIGSITLLTAMFIALGWFRINNVVLIGKGMGAVSMLFSLFMAFVPLLGIFLGFLFHSLSRGLFTGFQRSFDFRYHARVLIEYSHMITFAAYSLALAILPRIISTENVVNAMLRQRSWLSLIGYDSVSSLGLFGRYLKLIGTGFEVLGVFSLLLLLLLLTRRHLSIESYCTLRGIDAQRLRRSYLKFLSFSTVSLLVLSVFLAIIIALFLDAYIGITYTDGKVAFESGKFVVKSLFKPPHIFIWG